MCLHRTVQETSNMHASLCICFYTNGDNSDSGTKEPG